VGTENIWITGAPGVKDKAQLKKKGVTHILNMIGEGIYDVEWMGGKSKSYFPDDFTYKVLSTNDTKEQNLLNLFKETSAFIEQGAAAGGIYMYLCVCMFLSLSLSLTLSLSLLSE
jgi:hypothetical protein